jgi:hypothetical protein
VAVLENLKLATGQAAVASKICTPINKAPKERVKPCKHHALSATPSNLLLLPHPLSPSLSRPEIDEAEPEKSNVHPKLLMTPPSLQRLSLVVVVVVVV